MGKQSALSAASCSPVRIVRPLRVAVVLADGLHSRGGIGRTMLYLDRALAERTADIRLSAAPARRSERRILKHLSALPALAEFALRCATGTIDLAHINIAPRGSTWRKMAFAGAARLAGVPFILHLHGSGYDAFFAGLGPTSRRRVRALFGRAARTVVLSEHWRRFAVDQLALDSSRVTVIANGVAEPRALANPAASAIPTIVFAGEVGTRKGVPVLLEALAMLSREAVPFRAIIAGNGALAEARRQAAALGIAAQIDFPGWVGEAELDRLLRGASLFALPSLAENQPVAIIEAMARALPVVATTVGAIPEQVIDGETGLLVAPGDASALASALESLLTCPELRTRLGAAGRARFAAHYTITRNADRFAQLYREVTA